MAYSERYTKEPLHDCDVPDELAAQEHFTAFYRMSSPPKVTDECFFPGCTMPSPTKVEAQKTSDRGWQVGKSLAERMSQMLLKEIDCDVKFVFPSAKPKATLSAHRYMLKAASPVFEAMFSGSFAESDKNVDIVDIERDVFTEMLTYIYTDKATVSTTNAIALMSAARKYILDNLKNMCETFLKRSINENNVCDLLNSCLDFHESDLAQTCTQYMSSRVDRLMCTEGFLRLSNCALLKLLETKSHVTNEVELYQACVNWATNSIQKSGQTVSDEAIRETLGACLYQIRFTEMRADEVARAIASNCNILTHEEKDHLFCYILTKNVIAQASLQSLGFNVDPKNEKPKAIQQSQVSKKTILTKARRRKGRPITDLPVFPVPDDYCDISAH